MPKGTKWSHRRLTLRSGTTSGPTKTHPQCHGAPSMREEARTSARIDTSMAQATARTTTWTRMWGATSLWEPSTASPYNSKTMRTTHRAARTQRHTSTLLAVTSSTSPSTSSTASTPPPGVWRGRSRRWTGGLCGSACASTTRPRPSRPSKPPLISPGASAPTSTTPSAEKIGHGLSCSSNTRMRQSLLPGASAPSSPMPLRCGCV
mmetsp:Transcript_33342/g.68832  ORF Transcript_33342/g.68832 Transcript_33342/m.68832 type:complete len:206 (-) Transcript_33342:218-835(-)